jgi:pentalenolactone synthase
MSALRPRVHGLVSDLLEKMAAAGTPANLHESLSFPLPVLVICELLGVPYEDRERFRKWSGEVSNLLDEQLAQAALAEFFGYMVDLIGRKRDTLGEDVISDLIRAEEEWHVGVEETAALSVGLLFAGHETTMTRIDVGTTLLLSNPDQAAKLRAEPSLLPSAVEEILRLSGSGGGGGGLPRYAHEDVEINGITIKAGEAVLLPPGIANRDESAFDGPDTFDITRKSASGHLAFGHGGHFCIGASLARIELQEVFSLLLGRFPTLRLAVPVNELRPRTGTITAGLRELPVAW